MSAGSPQEPVACHVMAKPAGSSCNLDCRYCFYLEKEKLYPGRRGQWRMSDQILEDYVSQYIQAQDVPVVHFAWQGGEPTLMGIDFFRRAVELQKRWANGKTITNAFQTNGVLLDDEWGQFLAENRFLVGVSIDGPPELHDCYRVDKGQRPSFEWVAAGVQILHKHGVEFNTLTVVHHHNAGQPLAVYRFLKQLGSQFMQFIPIVERVAQQAGADGLELIAPSFAGDARVAPWSVDGRQYGRFLCRIFDEWVRGDVGRYFVQLFDVALGAWLGQPPGLCVFARTCGQSLVIEHNGDVYACDHFVYPEYRLGNVQERTVRQMVASPAQARFGQSKREELPEYCRQCSYLFACNGGCLKHRFSRTPEGEGGLNFLCQGYRIFFQQVDSPMQFMARAMRQGRPAAEVMEWVRRQEESGTAERPRFPGRNTLCPCGSGKKYKRCCGAIP